MISTKQQGNDAALCMCYCKNNFAIVLLGKAGDHFAKRFCPDIAPAKVVKPGPKKLL
jgi:hypothetical protein